MPRYVRTGEDGESISTSKRCTPVRRWPDSGQRPPHHQPCARFGHGGHSIADPRGARAVRSVVESMPRRQSGAPAFFGAASPCLRKRTSREHVRRRRCSATHARTPAAGPDACEEMAAITERVGETHRARRAGPRHCCIRPVPAPRFALRIAATSPLTTDARSHRFRGTARAHGAWLYPQSSLLVCRNLLHAFVRPLISHIS